MIGGCWGGFEDGGRDGRRRRTRVVCSTFASRGKSFTPESRMEMLEDRRALVELKDETHDERELDMSMSYREARKPGVSYNWCPQ